MVEKMGKYKIEVWQHHTKIDEYSSDDPKIVDKWFEEEYSVMYEWGKCCCYRFTDGQRVDSLRQKHKEEMFESKSIEEFTDAEKSEIINRLIDQIYEIKVTPERCNYYSSDGNIICSETDSGSMEMFKDRVIIYLKNMRFDSKDLLGSKLITHAYNKINNKK